MIAVTHPGRQHVHQLLYALQSNSIPFHFWTGLPSAASKTRGVLYRLALSISPHEPLDIPGQSVSHFFLDPIVRRFTRVVCSPATAIRWQHRSDNWFDRWCASRLGTVEADAVICYENAALHTFRAARGRGMTTILDAASFHHAWQDRHYDYPESDSAHARINAHKDQEIEHADHILTVSELARQSYIEGGVSPERVTAIPVGCDLSRFALSDQEDHDLEEPLTFIFAGHVGHRKGIDTVLKASAQLQEAGQTHRLWIAGGGDPDVPWNLAPHAERLGRLPQSELATRFQQADCLVLPSRHDSFGMVVVEAMATGCPAIVSEQTGAKEAITEGESGWVIPAEDVDALYDQMRWCIDNVEEVRSMAPSAHAAAQEYTWDRYRNRVASFLKTHLEQT